jgi:cellobiose transport system substrate-binding protein
MSVVRQRTNERRIPGRGLLGRLGPLGPALTAVCALLTACAVLAGCTAGPGQPAFKPGGPPVTLRIGVYGDPGYQRSGLYAEYERLHPNVRIVQTGGGPQAGYWQALQGALKSGRGTTSRRFRSPTSRR